MKINQPLVLNQDKSIQQTWKILNKINQPFNVYQKDSNEIFDSILKDNILISGSVNGQIVFWDIRNSSQILSVFYETQTEEIQCLDLKGTLLLAGSEDHSICLYDLQKQDEDESVELILCPQTAVQQVFFDTNSDICFSTFNNLMGVYDQSTGVKKYFYQYENSCDDKSNYFLKSFYQNQFGFYYQENNALQKALFDQQGNVQQNIKYDILDSSQSFVRDLQEVENTILYLTDDKKLKYCMKNEQQIQSEMEMDQLIIYHILIILVMNPENKAIIGNAMVALNIKIDF